MQKEKSIIVAWSVRYRHLLVLLTAIAITMGVIRFQKTAQLFTTIRTCQDLQDIENNLGEDYQLANNIDCSDTVNWNGGAGFDPIATLWTNAFSGTLNGNGFSVTGLTINRPTANSTAIFEALNANAVVENIAFIDTTITGGQYTGVITGYSINSTIQNISVTGTSTITGDQEVGAIAGALTDTSIANYVFSDANIIGNAGGTNMGGLFGFVTDSQINNSFASGNITAVSTNVGGLAGNIDSSSITNSYATGNVNGDADIGGLVGDVDGTSTVDNSFATGNVTKDALGATLPTNTGALVGNNNGTITNGYWNNHSGNPDECYSRGNTGCTSIADDITHFYNPANAPLSSWTFNATSWYQTALFPVHSFTPPSQTCSNSTIEGNEECDDGNTANGDGCSSRCQIENGYSCAGSPSSCDDIFTVMVLPDTQKYSETYNDYFATQTQWIVNTLDRFNTVFVTHEGDVVDNAVLAEWTVADAAMDILDGQIPYSTLPGNHDYEVVGNRSDASDFISYFGPTRYSGYPWYGGNDPTERNYYQYFSGNNWDFMHIALEWEADDQALSWAQGVLNENSHLPTIVTTHSYIYDQPGDEGRTSSPQSGDGNSGETIFQKLISPNNQIFMVLNGHWHRAADDNDGEYHQTSTNAAGNDVFEVLANYQDRPNGGDGKLRILSFVPSENEIRVQTYSPALGAYETDANSAFTLPINFANRFNLNEQGPKAQLAVPLDNGESDQDTDVDAVRITTSVQSVKFVLGDGNGVDDATVTPNTVTVQRNGITLEQNTDYTFAYGESQNTITISSISGNLASGTYSFAFSAGIKDVLGNSMTPKTISLVTVDALVNRGANWNYLDDGSDQGTAWQAIGFDDSGWASGNAQLGYGDGDETTTVSFGPDSDNKYATTYFRHAFTPNSIADITELTLEALFDDGVAMYLNGTEIFRNRLDDDADFSDYATSDQSDESRFYEASVSPQLLVSGTNVLTAEVHQGDGESSDISFDASLIAERNFCGDSKVRESEQCDDGNTTNGDGCSSTCKSESGYTYPQRESAWKYLDDGSDQGTAWIDLGFDDSSWNIGEGQLGYGDDDEQTTISYGNDSNNKHITTYFRRSFEVVTKNTLHKLRLETLYDDGVAVYLNGTEIFRDLLSENASYTDAALTYKEDEDAYTTVQVDTDLIRTGTNILAVEVHQNTPTSSDLSFDAALVAELEICGDGTTVGNEQCDDGNTANGDGCSSSCKTEDNPSSPTSPNVSGGGGGGGGGGSGNRSRSPFITNEDRGEQLHNAASDAIAAAREQARGYAGTKERKHLAIRPRTPKTALSDVQNHWSKEYVQHLQTVYIPELGRPIIQGFDDGTFRPNEPVTRFQLLKMVLMALDIPIQEYTGTIPFSDLANLNEPEADFKQYVVMSAVVKGIARGYEDETFKPNANITRAEAMKIFAEAADIQMQGKQTLQLFTDVPADAWYAQYVQAMWQEQFVGGHSDYSFKPGDALSRAEAAKILSLVLDSKRGLYSLEAE